MAPIAISLLAFALALVGVLLGTVVQRMLPEGHLSSDSKEVVKLSMGVVATLAALVLGLLVASAKSTYDARESEINQITAYVILLDNLLAKYGEEAKPRESHYVRQFRQWSTEFGEKDDLSNCRKRLSRPVLRARLSTSGLRSSNRPMRSSADCRQESTRLLMI